MGEKRDRKKTMKLLKSPLLNCKATGLSGAWGHKKNLWTALHLLAVPTDTSFSELHSALLFPMSAWVISESLHGGNENLNQSAVSST